VRLHSVEWQVARRVRSIGARYAMALLAFLVSFFLRDALSPWLHDRDYVVFVPAIVLVTFFAGLAPAILTTVLSAVAVWYFFTPQLAPFGFDAVDNAVALVSFILSGVVAIALVHWLRISIDRADAERTKVAALARQKDADFSSVMRLNQLGIRLLREEREQDECLNDILDTAIALLAADKGIIQRFDSASGALTLAAQRGFKEPFLEFFSSMQEADLVCGAARQTTDPVIVTDITQSELFAGKPSLKVLIDADVRAVISTPLTSSAGDLLGMISAYYGMPHRQNERDLHFFTLLTRQAADYLQRKRAQETEKLLIREMKHRSDNQLAIVSAIARRCFVNNPSVSEAMDNFEGRLSALAGANRKLIFSNFNWSASLEEIVRSTLEPFSARTNVAGCCVMLGPQLARNISLAVHELATNAMKYGALSNSEGLVDISWAVTQNGALSLHWNERGGPPVVTPKRHGFGTSLIRDTFADVRIDYAREGLHCEIVALLHNGSSGVTMR